MKVQHSRLGSNPKPKVQVRGWRNVGAYAEFGILGFGFAL